MKFQTIKNLKSVTIKASGFKRNLIIPPNLAKQFLFFLQENIGNEIILVNTNIGIQIFYYSTKNYSQFIKESMLFYAIKLNQNVRLNFTNQLDGNQVRKQFKNAIYTFSQYPRLFLAYSKKFIQIKKENTQSKIVMPFLNTCFEKTITSIIEKNGMIPFQNELNKNKIKALESEINKKILFNLYDDIKHHLN
ncbi:hypothetical protein [Aquimarina agarilytica]|uniref:hypothetical protein n=1 Tax=Aquimarina agarilytica TaxID=1087449 RepID=UPI000289AF11|nr:hypothetical protein [Aquimarina agarilytica]